MGSDGGLEATATIGREPELAAIREWVLGDGHLRALVIEGAPGLGKTTLWDSARSFATGAGARVLPARAAEAETSLSFAVLSDLLADVDVGGIAGVPPPQARALEVALLRADPGDRPIESRAVALGLLNVLQGLAADGPLLLAVDDLQWVDPSSAGALAFSLRRAAGAPIRLLATRRPEGTRSIEAAVGREAVATLGLTGLSLGATRRLLHARFGIALSRRVARQVHELTLGNPLFALEIGRVVADSGPPPAGHDLEVPDSLEELLGDRATSALGAGPALLAVALGGPLPETELASIAGQTSVDAALDAALVVRNEGRIEPAHPLVAASIVKRSSAEDRRSTHAALGRLTSDGVRRARHLSAAATERDAELARLVAAGAAEARARGDSDGAIGLAEEALRLTPTSSPDRPDRVLTLGEYLLRGGEPARLRELMDAELSGLPPGTPRARGHLLTAHVPQSQEEYDQNLARVLAESQDGHYRVLALVEQSIDATTSYAERLPEAAAKADEARRLGGRGPAGHAALFAAAWVRALQGRPIDDIRTEDALITEHRGSFEHDLDRVRAVQLAFRGRIDAARAILLRGLERSATDGNVEAWSMFQHHLAELDARSGDRLALDARVLEGRSDAYTERLGTRPHWVRLMTLAAALRGDVEATARLADETRALVVGQRWDLLEIDRAIGLAALAANDPHGALEPLLRTWQHVVAEDLGEPGAFPVSADLVEAALGTGDRDLACRVTSWLAERSMPRRHPWGLVTARRCIAMLALADADDPAARASLASAARRYRALGARFDAARTLLTLGRHARRARKWAIARETLEDAATAFAELGCDGWADQARQLLAGLGGRRPATSPDALTPTERRVVGLASDGLTNKDIAAALFVGVHTVEVHLGHAYQKLGVQSRSQLAKALATLDREAPTSII